MDSLHLSNHSADSATMPLPRPLSVLGRNAVVPLSVQDSQRGKYHLPFRAAGWVAYSPSVIHLSILFFPVGFTLPPRSLFL